VSHIFRRRSHSFAKNGGAQLANDKQKRGAKGQVLQKKSSPSADVKSTLGNNNNNNNNANNANPGRSKAGNEPQEHKKSTGSNLKFVEKNMQRDIESQVNAVLERREANTKRAFENKLRQLDSITRTLQSGKALPARGSLLTTNLVKFAQQIVNPQATVDIQPLPGADAKSYLKSVWQPFRQVNLAGGKASICMAPHCDVPLWVSIPTNTEVTSLNGLKEFKLHRVRADASERSVIEIDTIVSNQLFRASATCTEIPGSFILRGESDKEGGFLATFPHQGIFHYYDELSQTWTDLSVEQGAYWFMFNSTTAPVSIKPIASIELLAKEITGAWFESNDLESLGDTTVISFPGVEQGDPAWYTELTFQGGERCFKGYANGSIYNNPILERHLVTASSILLTNDAPALYSGGELIQARVTTFPLPRMTDTDISTWISTQSTYGYTGKLKEGGYQYHVPNADNSLNVVSSDCPFKSNAATYWMCIDYSVIINGQNPPSVIPMHLVHTEIFGYGGADAVVAPSAAAIDIGHSYMLSSMFTNYKPLKNGNHLTEIVSHVKSVFDDMVDYGKRLINTKVPVGLVEQLVTKGVPIALDLGEVIGTFLAEAI